MLAGAIEFTSSPCLGKQLIELANASEGLAHIPYDHSDSWTNGKVTLVQQLFWNTPESTRVEGVACHEQTGARITAWARIDNRLELQGQLPEDLHYLARTDPGLILACYLHWHERACEKLIGDFCFAVFDPRTESLYCGRDHLGVRPFYYYWDGSNFLFASSIAILARLKGINLELSDEWLARYLLYISRDWQLTAYQQIKKLPPAEIIMLRGGKLVHRKYFNFSDIQPLGLAGLDEYVEVYRQQLTEAVRCRVSSNYPVGSESSGGLDSATVTALAAQCMRDPGIDLHCFGHATDEYSPARILSVSQSVPMCMTHLVTNTGLYAEDPTGVREAFFENNGVPEEHANATYHNMFYKTAAGFGARTMLSGFGGDEFVTTEGQLVLTELWRTRQLGKFISRQSGNRVFSALKWLAENVLRTRQSASTRAFTKNFRDRLQLSLVNEETINAYGIRSLLEREASYDSGRNSLNEFTLEARLDPWLAARLENCMLMAARYRIEYRWPLLDVRLIKLFLAIPAEYKLGPGGRTRYLHRCAVKDLIPEEVNWGSKYTGKFVGRRNYDLIEDRTKQLEPHPRLQSLLSEPHFKQLIEAYRQMDANNPASLDQLENYVQFTSLNHWLNYIQKNGTS